jgi:hypothetical protein
MRTVLTTETVEVTVRVTNRETVMEEVRVEIPVMKEQSEGTRKRRKSIRGIHQKIKE